MNLLNDFFLIKLTCIAGIIFSALTLCSCHQKKLINTYNLTQSGHPQYIRFDQLKLNPKKKYERYYSFHYLEENYPSSHKTLTVGDWVILNSKICLLPTSKKIKNGRIVRPDSSTLSNKSIIRGSRSTASRVEYSKTWSVDPIIASDSTCFEQHKTANQIYLYNYEKCYLSIINNDMLRYTRNEKGILTCDSLKRSLATFKKAN